MNQMGIKNLINRNAPAGEQVAFINEREVDLLRRSGGSGRTDNNPYGIPSYDDLDESGGDYGDYSGAGEPSFGMNFKVTFKKLHVPLEICFTDRLQQEVINVFNNCFNVK